MGLIVGIYSDKNNPVILAVFHANWKNGELKVNDDEVIDDDDAFPQDDTESAGTFAGFKQAAGNRTSPRSFLSSLCFTT